ncbi:hypothetical protein C8R45DRAFT_1091164 [Mycena sanguinolenta]|nr:hypothetical protein C8R45DRAFT_1091164 [Mycena sanguinolenta]
MEPVASSSRTHDAKSVVSESATLCSGLPLPPLPPAPPPNRPRAPPARNVGGITPELPHAALCGWMTAISFVVWCRAPVLLYALSRMINTGASHWVLGYLLTWIACSGVFIIFILIFVVSVLMRNPPKSYVDTVRRLAIFMTVISVLIAVGAFPILGEWSRETNVQARKVNNNYMQCIGGGTLWSIAWIFSIHELWRRI